MRDEPDARRTAIFDRSRRCRTLTALALVVLMSGAGAFAAGTAGAQDPATDDVRLGPILDVEPTGIGAVLTPPDDYSLLDLSAGDVTVTRGGEQIPAQLEPLAAAQLDVVVVADLTSDEASVQAVRGAVDELVRTLPAGASVALLSAGDEPRVAVPFTTNPTEVLRSLADLRPSRRESLGASLGLGLATVRSGSGSRSAVVVVSPASPGTDLDGIEQAVGSGGAEAAVYLTSVGADQAPELQRIIEGTGGRLLPVDQAGALVGATDDVSGELANQYRIDVRLAGPPSGELTIRLDNAGVEPTETVVDLGELGVPTPGGDQPAGVDGEGAAGAPGPSAGDGGGPPVGSWVFVVAAVAVIGGVAMLGLRRARMPGRARSGSVTAAETGEPVPDQPPPPAPSPSSDPAFGNERDPVFRHEVVDGQTEVEAQPVATADEERRRQPRLPASMVAPPEPGTRAQRPGVIVPGHRGPPPELPESPAAGLGGEPVGGGAAPIAEPQPTVEPGDVDEVEDGASSEPAPTVWPSRSRYGRAREAQATVRLAGRPQKTTSTAARSAQPPTMSDDGGDATVVIPSTEELRAAERADTEIADLDRCLRALSDGFPLDALTLRCALATEGRRGVRVALWELFRARAGADVNQGLGSEGVERLAGALSAGSARVRGPGLDDGSFAEVAALVNGRGDDASTVAPARPRGYVLAERNPVPDRSPVGSCAAVIGPRPRLATESPALRAALAWRAVGQRWPRPTERAVLGPVAAMLTLVGETSIAEPVIDVAGAMASAGWDGVADAPSVITALTAVEAASRDARLRLDRLVELRDEAVADVTGPRPGQASALVDLMLANPILTAGYVADVLDVTHQGALNLIREAESKRWLRCVGAFGRGDRTYWVAPHVLVIVDDELHHDLEPTDHHQEV